MDDYSEYGSINSSREISPILIAKDDGWKPIMTNKHHKINILQMIQHKDLKLYKQTIQEFSSIELNNMDFGGETILHILCYMKSLEFLKTTLETGISVDSLNIDGNSALQIAVKRKWRDGVNLLLNHGCSVDQHQVKTVRSGTEYLDAPVLIACKQGDTETLKMLLEFQPDLSVVDFQWNTVLHLAASSASISLIDLVLSHSSWNRFFNRNVRGDSALHCLLIRRTSDIDTDRLLTCMEMLLRAGFDVNASNNIGETPLYLAVKASYIEVVVTLLGVGARATCITKIGKSLIHAACESGSTKILEILMETRQVNDLFLKEDSFGVPPFHEAVMSSSLECCEFLLSHGDHLTNTDSNGISRMEFVLENLPSAYLLLDRLLDSHIYVSELSKSHSDFHITMDFGVLLPGSSYQVQESIIEDFGSDQAEQLLRHPLIESFLYLKWSKVKVFFYAHVLIYLLFLLFHSHYIIKMYTGPSTHQHTYSIGLYCIQLCLIIALGCTAIVQLIANLKRFSRQYETYFKFIALTSALLILLWKKIYESDPMERLVASTSIFFNWVEIMMLLGRFPSLGVYILMFSRVSRSFAKFLVAFMSLIVAFALVFAILLHNVVLFQSFPSAFVRTLMMMVGEIEYETIYTSIYDPSNENSKVFAVFIQFFLVAFIFLIPVLLANLLIGLAVNDLPGLENFGKVRRLLKEASYLVSYERVFDVLQRMFSILPWKMIIRYNAIPSEITIYPNRSRLSGSGKISPIIPSETLAKAIAIGLREYPAERAEPENFSRGNKDVLLKFWNHYSKKQDIMDQKLDEIQDILKTITNNSKPKLKTKFSYPTRPNTPCYV